MFCSGSPAPCQTESQMHLSVLAFTEFTFCVAAVVRRQGFTIRKAHASLKFCM